MTNVALQPSSTSNDAASSVEALTFDIPRVSKAPVWKRIVGKISRFWLLAAIVIFWQFISTVGVRVDPQLDVMLPPPTAVLSAAHDLYVRGVLFTHIFASLRRVLVAVSVAAALGIPLGLAMGWFAKFRAVVDPVIQFIRPIPPLAWIPLSILWFGIGDVQIDYIIFLAAFFPVVLNCMAGARDTNTHLVRAGLSLGASPFDLFRTVLLPGALPHIFTGLRIALGFGWMALVAGELVAAPSGLGYLINNARTLFRSDYILLGMVLIGALGLVLDFLMQQLGRLVMPWNKGK